MDIADVKIIFKNPWTLQLFPRIVKQLDIEPNLAFQWIYKHIFGNCIKKDLEFQTVLEDNFGEEKLVDLLALIKAQKVSVANAKEVMMRVIDGDKNLPSEIAASLGFIGDALTTEEV